MEEEVADIKCVLMCYRCARGHDGGGGGRHQVCVDVLQVCEGTQWRRRWQTSSVCLMCYRCARGHDGGGGGRHQVCV